MSFTSYPKYKASGVEWLGEVPEGWETAQLRHFVDIENGKDYKQVEQSEGFPVYGSGGVFAYASDFLYNGESVLLGRKGTIDKPLYVNGPFWTVDTMYWTRIRPHTSGKYVYYAATTFPFDLYSTSTALPSMTKGVLSGHVMARPPLPEQTAIAEFLDRETGKIDELVAEQRRLMDLLKEKITSLVLSSVDLPSTQRLRFGDAASIISRPVLQQEEESYTRIGLFNRGRGLFHKDASEMDDMGESDFFWIEEGDLIISGQFAWEGAVALAGKADTGCVVSHRYPVLRGVPGIALTEYLFGLLCTNHGDFLLNENSRGAAGRNRPLNIRYLMKETIPVPSIQIQETVARAIHSRAVLFQEISNAIDLLQERRTALISAAVTGKIDVRNYTPSS